MLEEMTGKNPLDGVSSTSAIDYGRLSDEIGPAKRSDSHDNERDQTYALSSPRSRRQFRRGFYWIRFVGQTSTM